MSKELEAWLSKLRLEQYAPAFRFNAIDMAVLADLSDIDLIEIGVAPLGHRKRLLSAIADVRHSGFGAIPPIGAQAERRQVSVLFCDVVGSTALAHRLDPEELAMVMDDYHKAASEKISQKGGYVAQLQGDGVMAYFGWPTVHEDDASRAVAVGLELVEVLPQLSTPGGLPIAVRVGVATGLVVIGGQSAADGRAMGEAPNIAARLQAEAEPNTLVVSPLTARLAGRSFHYKSLGKRAMRGVPEPLEVLQVSGTRPSLNRFKALRARSAAPLVGRSGEFELLLSRWQRASEGEGQIVLLSGDAGIGKSRLVQATREQIGRSAHVLRFQCSPLHQDTALFPVIQQLMQSIGIEGQQTTVDKVAKVQKWLSSTNDNVTDHLSLLCHLLDLKSPDQPLPDPPPQEMRRRTVGLLSQLFMQSANTAPVLAIVEDAHWGDPTSIELLIGILSNIKRLPVMVLATRRETFSQDWHCKGYTTELRLDRLSGSESRELIRAVAGGRLSERVCSSIADRAEGVPLYIEELTLALLEGHNARDLDEVPKTLQALLAERLDRLGSAKQLLQFGAIIGRQFALADIPAIADRTDTEVRVMAVEALGSGLLQEAIPGSDSVLRFKHALVQDAAYASLLNSERRRLHAAALTYLEQGDRLAVPGAAVVLASHAERGEVWEKASRYLAEALRQAVKRSAHREAIGLYERALKALQRLPPDRSAKLAIDVRLRAYSPFVALRELDRLVETMRQADELARVHGDKRQRAKATAALSFALLLIGQHQTGLRSAEEAVRLANELDDFALRQSARFNQAVLLQATGEIRDATEIYTAILMSLTGEREHIPSIVILLQQLTEALVMLGEFERARQAAGRAMALVDKIRDHESVVGLSKVHAYWGVGIYQSAIGQVQAAIDSVEAASLIVRQTDIVNPHLTAWLASSYAQGGRASDALALLLDAKKILYSSGGQTDHYIALAETHLALGAVAEARTAIGRAQEIAEHCGELAKLAQVFRLRGSIEAADLAPDERATCVWYKRAIELARPRGLRPLVAKCLAGMAEAWQVEGDVATAADYRAQAQRIFDELGVPSSPSSDPRR
jgi:class 3 adenylate cyclase/tetratricopeptide (TPR) repeat protein